MAKSKREKERRQKQLAKERRERELAAMGIATVNTKRKRNTRTNELKVSKTNETYRREDNQEQYRSLSTSLCNTARRESSQYTGTYVKGVMETHKSNIVPVVSDEHIVAITKMRRN